MRAKSHRSKPSMLARFNYASQRFRKNEDGATAIEFAMVSIPFFMLMFGTITAGLFYFTTFSLENAVEKAARQLRTGQAQLAGKTTQQFKADVCAEAPAFVDCTNNLRVNVISSASFNGAANNMGACLDNSGDLIPEPATTPVPGAAGDVVLVTVCYEWELAGVMPYLEVGTMANGSALIQASTTFRTEPYN